MLTNLNTRQRICLLVFVFMPVISLAASFVGKDTKPNILIILTDDLGFGDLSCQGTTDIRTPNIDRIFESGMRFSNFYANSTVCSPTRASMLSGCYPDMVGVPGVIRTSKEDSWGYLSPKTILLPEVLKKSEYQTALIGKWHLGLEAPNLPNQKGFDYFHGFLGDMMDDYYHHRRQGNNYLREDGKEIQPNGHATEIFTEWAIDYLNKTKGDKKPFFMLLAYNAPHSPVQPPEEWLQKINKREPKISEKRAKLVALIEHLDWNVGRVIETLEINGQLQNTLIIFTSDNGGDLSQGADNGMFRGGKQDMYEGGIRVPMAMMWKGQIVAGSKCTELSMTMDLFPTICEIAGVSQPESVNGLSLWPVVSGRKNGLDDRTLYFVRREGNMKYGGMAYYAARFKEYKILQNTPWEPIQFFNLKDDPLEKNPIEIKGSKNYETLFIQLTEHIRKAGNVPWQP